LLEIVAGADPREELGFQVSRFSAYRKTTEPLTIIPLREKALRYQGIYKRRHEEREGRLWCPISEAPMSTNFAVSRFLAKFLVEGNWTLFCDFADMLFLGDPAELFALADERYAVMVVKRDFRTEAETKMDGQVQTEYPRKLWSSVILWNVAHPGNARLTFEMVNELPGRDLHRFCWLEDHEIGALPLAWNWVAGVDSVADRPGLGWGSPKLLHYSLGPPFMPGYENGPWSAQWHRERAIMDSMHRRPAA
jgi:lipopolysaccharide biosynthesis glycosyltransferase